MCKLLVLRALDPSILEELCPHWTTRPVVVVSQRLPRGGGRPREIFLGTPGGRPRARRSGGGGVAGEEEEEELFVRLFLDTAVNDIRPATIFHVLATSLVRFVGAHAH
ncbi:unnamed protein product [Prorocentrum cordatum]|uniref:Uncharacterized protein n=1 Tax=Prorocentrum cordatum TaxID=2364126 RepID=A0ABN9XWN0_9DINO|nr:unnamed protein product [Polarella glacialis]